MRVLHLFSNAKWTGPAEPALNLCVALRKRGIEADFACAPDAGQSINKVVETARDRGIEPILRFHLRKHRHPIRNAQDRRALHQYLAAQPYDLIHCHMDNDHAIAVRPAARHGIPLLRSNYEGPGLAHSRRQAKLLSQTAFLMEPSRQALENDAEAFGFPKDHMEVVPGAVDVERFDPQRETPDGRRWLGIPPQAFVIGIVARMQRHRHYEDLFEAIHALLAEAPNAHLVVVGRGTKQQEVGAEPVQRLGLEAHVHFAGFIEGENFVGMLRGFDAGAFLTPGTDGTCRAVRELMAMGKPMVVADRGMLAEIVTHGEDGLVTDGSPKALHEAFLRLHQNRTERAAMGKKARQTAVARYSLEAQSAQVSAIYERILSGKSPSNP